MSDPLSFTHHLTTITSGFDGRTCWVQARGGVMPGSDRQPVAVVTMQKLLLSGSDIFYSLHESRSDDRGESWSPLREIPSTRRWKEPPNIEAVLCDATPTWHAATGKLLCIGHVARYVGDHLMPWPRPRQAGYTIYDPATAAWSPVKLLAMPDEKLYFSSGAGSAQRVDLPDGDILLPIYFTGLGDDKQPFSAAVLRCGFDGQTLAVKQVGSAHSVPIVRGLYEPSITQHQGRFYLTLRNDEAGYVADSDDGLHFNEPRLWTFDDGQLLGNFNTQQHWVSHSDGLYLVYTRRGLNNEHVFRCRAPLVIAQVDPQKLVVLRDTERVIVPERGARLGNFSVIDFDERETWVVAAEWMQNVGMREDPEICTRHGSDNSVFVARLRWNKPNRQIQPF